MKKRENRLVMGGIAKLRDKLGVTTEDLANLLNARKSDVQRWEMGISEPKSEVSVTISRLIVISEEFPDYHDSKKSLIKWLQAPNHRLQRKKPIDVLRYRKGEENYSDFIVVEKLVKEIGSAIGVMMFGFRNRITELYIKTDFRFHPL